MKEPEFSAEVSPWEELKSHWSAETTSFFEASWSESTPETGVSFQLRLDCWHVGASSEEIVSSCACAVAVRAYSHRADLNLCAWSQKRFVSFSVTLTEAGMEFSHERWLATSATHFRRCGVASSSSCTVDVRVFDVGASPECLCDDMELLAIQ